MEKEVVIKTLKAGEELKQFQACSYDEHGTAIPKQGNYYAQGETKAEELGINPKYKHKGDLKNRVVKFYILTKAVEVLCSTTLGIKDTWSNPDKAYDACGGGIQMCCTDKMELMPKGP